MNSNLKNLQNVDAGEVELFSIMAGSFDPESTNYAPAAAFLILDPSDTSKAMGIKKGACPKFYMELVEKHQIKGMTDVVFTDENDKETTFTFLTSEIVSLFRSFLYADTANPTRSFVALCDINLTKGGLEPVGVLNFHLDMLSKETITSIANNLSPWLAYALNEEEPEEKIRMSDFQSATILAGAVLYATLKNPHNKSILSFLKATKEEPDFKTGKHQWGGIITTMDTTVSILRQMGEIYLGKKMLEPMDVVDMVEKMPDMAPYDSVTVTDQAAMRIGQLLARFLDEESGVYGIRPVFSQATDEIYRYPWGISVSLVSDLLFGEGTGLEDFFRTRTNSREKIENSLHRTLASFAETLELVKTITFQWDGDMAKNKQELSDQIDNNLPRFMLDAAFDWGGETQYSAIKETLSLLNEDFENSGLSREDVEKWSNDDYGPKFAANMVRVAVGVSAAVRFKRANPLSEEDTPETRCTYNDRFNPFWWGYVDNTLFTTTSILGKIMVEYHNHAAK